MKERRKILRDEKAKRGVEKKEKKEKLLREITVKIIDDGLSFIFPFDIFYFILLFLFHYFLYLEQLGLGLIGHAVTSVTT